MIFTPANLRARFRGQPFRPVRVVTSTGQTYDIYHPDLVLVGTHDLAVGVPDPTDPESYGLMHRVALVHITELRDLSAVAPPPTANGQAAS